MGHPQFHIKTAKNVPLEKERGLHQQMFSETDSTIFVGGVGDGQDMGRTTRIFLSRCRPYREAGVGGLAFDSWHGTKLSFLS